MKKENGIEVVLKSRELDNTQLCREAVSLKKNIEVTFLVLGEKLKIIKKEQSWEGVYEDWQDFIENGLKMNTGTASKLITVFETFIEKYDFPMERLADAEWTKLYKVIPLIEGKEDAEDWVGKLKNNTISDIGRFIKEKQTGKEMDKCEHDYEEITMLKCRNCGIKIIKFKED